MKDRRARAERGQDEAEDWVKVLDRLPFVSSARKDANALRSLLYERRAPRLAVVGRPGSGRSSLANALLSARTFGEDGAVPGPARGRWMRIDADGRRLDWLELPAELERGALVELARRAFDESTPDVLVGVVEAGTERTAGGTVHDALDALLSHLGDHHGHKPPVLVLLSKVDTLPPVEAASPYPPDKVGAIERGLSTLRSRLADLGQPDEVFLAVCAAPPGAVGEARWNVDRVSEELLERLPDPAKVEGVRALAVGRGARREVARTLVNSCSALAVTVGLAPIPFADAFVLLPLQAAMVTGIAYLSGRPWDRRAATEWLASVGLVGGAGLGLRWGARQLIKFIPGAGSLLGAGVAGAGTLAIGQSAVAYFIDGPGGMSRRPELLAQTPAR